MPQTNAAVTSNAAGRCAWCWSFTTLILLSLACAAPRRAAAAQEKAPQLEAAPNLNLALPRAALGKDYLLTASIIPQVLSPTSTGLAGRIVRFELFHDGVDLYESTQGLVVTDELPVRRLLTTFPIVEQNDARVVIDFNKGMRRVFTDIWYGGGPGFDAASRARTLEVPQSRVFEMKRAGDQLVIRQSAQTRDRQADANREERYEIRYFLGPYQPGDFQSREHTVADSKYVRFFETQAHIEPITGRPTSKTARFDMTEPVVFYYSDNTPAEYEEAVKQGVLYWNRAFGKEALRVEKAPKGMTAPDAAHNLVQWVPWDSAGFAYADILVDPRTGASQRGQAYITSVFAISGKSRARELLRLMRGVVEAKEAKEKSDPKPGPASGPALGIDFLPPASVCQVDPVQFAQQLATGLEGLLAEGKLDDATALQAAQDYVCEVVAHEVGHVLGLRHNFAASLTANLTHKELDDWFRAYVSGAETNTYAGKLPTSSVMDYNVFKASVLLGHQIRTGQDPLPYDKAAIQWGYFNSAEPQEKHTLLGTDQDAAGYGDVRTFDYGSEPVVSAYASIAEQIRNLPNSVIETFIRTKAPRDPRDRRPLAEVNLSVGQYAGAIASGYESLLQWYKAASRSIEIERTFDFVGDLNRKEVLQAHWKVLNEQLDKLGGVDRAAFAYLPLDLKLELKEEPKDIVAPEKIDAKKLADRLGKLLESPAYTNFVGLDEKTYTFTKEEKELILKRGQKFFEEFEKEVVKRTLLVLEKAQRDLGVEAAGAVGDEDATAKLEKRIIDVAKVVIMAKNDAERRRGKVDKSFVEVQDFKYEQETRLAAARALGDTIGSFKGWAVDAKSDLNKQLKDEVEAALNIQNFKSFQDSMLSRPLREWYLNQQAILALLPAKPPASGAPAPAPTPPKQVAAKDDAGGGS